MLRDLMERRARLREEAQGIMAAPAGEGGDLTAVQENRFDEIETEIGKLDKRLERASRLDEIERRSPTGQAPGGDSFVLQLRNYSLMRAVAGQAGLGVDDGLEREIAQEVRALMPNPGDGMAVPLGALIDPREVRAITSDAGGTGDHLIGTQIAQEVVDVLRSEMVTARLGVRTLNGLVGNLDMPKKTSDAAADWFADGAQITEDDPAFDGIAFRPKTN